MLPWHRANEIQPVAWRVWMSSTPLEKTTMEDMHTKNPEIAPWAHNPLLFHLVQHMSHLGILLNSELVALE